MIKSTFYNLPEEKRRRVIGAIVAEFSNTEDEKISINRIIKRADISRGSFYQYFDDKVDLIEVLLKSFVDRVLAGATRVFYESKGDMFLTFAALLDVIVESGDDPVRRVVLKRLIRNLRANDDLVSEYMCNRFHGIDEFKDSYKQFDRRKLRFQSDEDLELITQILTGILKNALFNLFAMEEDYAAVKDTYLKKIEIIKLGAEVSA